MSTNIAFATEPARQTFYACRSRAEPVEFANNCVNNED